LSSFAWRRRSFYVFFTMLCRRFVNRLGTGRTLTARGQCAGDTKSAPNRRLPQCPCSSPALSGATALCERQAGEFPRLALMDLAPGMQLTERQQAAWPCVLTRQVAADARFCISTVVCAGAPFWAYSGEGSRSGKPVARRHALDALTAAGRRRARQDACH